MVKEKLIKGFKDKCGRAPEVVSHAPGRLEILGNHTDYNEGVVLSVAVDMATWFAAAKAEGKTCTVHDLGYDCVRSFELDALGDTKRGEWIRYITGIIVELNKRGLEVPAFDAVIDSTVPMSAGMSSSAALEIATAYALGELAGIELPWVEWAKVGQACENNTVGARTGLLDQFSSIMGRKDQLVYSDFRSLEVKNVPLPAGTALVVANSMVKHDLTEEYNERRARCEEAVAVLAQEYDGVAALRDVSHEQLDACKEKMDIMAYRRAQHVVGENERVFAGIEALQAGELTVFGDLMFQSHDSSRLNFENSCPELDSLVEIGKSLPGALGARLSGGGFGGITVHLVEQDQAEEYAKRLATAYASLIDKDPQVMICHAGDGAQVEEI